MLVRSWNLFHGNTVPPQRRGFLAEMVELATSDRPDILCLQEVPAWALGGLPVGDLASRPPLGVSFGRAATALHHGLIRGGLAGQGIAMWLGPHCRLLGHWSMPLNERSYRGGQARALGLPWRARWAWAKERRVVQIVRVEVGGQTYVIGHTHCTGFAGDSRIPDDELLRSARLAASRRRQHDVLVLVGDFNLRPGRSQALSVLARPPWSLSAPGRGIDHVLVGGAAASPLRVWDEERRRRPDGGMLSDHAPVELDIGPADLLGVPHESVPA